MLVLLLVLVHRDMLSRLNKLHSYNFLAHLLGFLELHNKLDLHHIVFQQSHRKHPPPATHRAAPLALLIELHVVIRLSPRLRTHIHVERIRCSPRNCPKLLACASTHGSVHSCDAPMGRRKKSRILYRMQLMLSMRPGYVE